MAKEFKPHIYQEEVIQHIKNRPYAGLFLTMGLGKTASTLQAFTELKEEKYVDKLFVIAPLRVAHVVWPSEIKKWKQFENLKIIVLHGKEKDHMLKHIDDADVVVINPAGLPWLAECLVEKLFTFKTYEWMLAVDESSQFKSSSSKRFRLLKKLIPAFKRRIILTGSPTPNGLQQLWSQIYLLDEGTRLSKYVTHFRDRYFNKTGYMGYEYKLKEGAEEQIYEKIGDIVVHKSLDELDLPPITYNNLCFELPYNIRKTYDHMKKELVAELKDDNLAIAVNAAVAVNKLKQISNGGIYYEENQYEYLHNKKTETVEEMVESLAGRPLLVAYEYNHDLLRLSKSFPKAKVINGKTSSTELLTTVKRWNEGKIPLLIVQIMAASHGLNLQESGCQDVAWYSIPYDLELYNQFNARVYRQGVENHVTIHHIVGKKTVDERIVKVLKKKSSVQDKLLDALEI